MINESEKTMKSIPKIADWWAKYFEKAAEDAGEAVDIESIRRGLVRHMGKRVEWLGYLPLYLYESELGRGKANGNLLTALRGMEIKVWPKIKPWEKMWSRQVVESGKVFLKSAGGKERELK